MVLFKVKEMPPLRGKFSQACSTARKLLNLPFRAYLGTYLYYYITEFINTQVGKSFFVSFSFSINLGKRKKIFFLYMYKKEEQNSNLLCKNLSSDYSCQLIVA